jgi:hypothetical protein
VSLRSRGIALAVIVVLAISGAVAYALDAHKQHSNRNTAAPAVARTNLTAIESGPRIVFRNTALGPDYGRIAMVALSDPSGPRAVTATSCDRVYASSAEVLCLSSHQGLVTTYQAAILGAQLRPQLTLPLAGIPSRARLSQDGSLAATTSFTAGDSYAGTNFSTRTVISRVHGTKANAAANLEDFALVRSGMGIKPVDRNYWGVTFAQNDDIFYVTVAFGGHTYLARGTLSSRALTILRTDAECPSLSPDGRTIVYKKRNGQPAGHWRLASYVVATGKETTLAETRNVDDQVAWLDDSHVVYGIPRSGSQAAVDDIYSVPDDGTGTAKLLISGAWSPAIIR